MSMKQDTGRQRAAAVGARAECFSHSLVARLRHAANEKRARIRQTQNLSDLQRKLALELLRQQTEDEMRRALGQQEFAAFKAFHHWWFRELATAA